MDYLIALAALAAGGTAYYLACRWWPFGPCLACIGHPGKNRGSSARRWGTCRRCKGSGKRVRLGARILRVMKEGK